MASAHILKPYERRREAGLLTRGLLGIALVLLAAFYGLMCSILPMQLIVVPAVPLLLLTALIFWLLPDIGGYNEAWLANGIVWFTGLNVVWPSYVALNAPGLPWITPTRIVLFGLIAVAVTNYATSAELRTRIRIAMNSVPLARKLFWGFWAITSLSLLMSSQPFQSINKYANNQIYWTMMFALSAWLATREGFAMRIGRVLAWSIIVVCLVALAEYRAGAPIWIGRLPAFLKIDSELLEQLGSLNARAGTDIYRVRGTFGGALYFAEYLALAFPFVVHFLFAANRFGAFVLMAAGTVLVATVMVLTNSRSAMLALLLTLLIYGFMFAWRLRQQRPESIGASAALFAYPVFALVLAMLVLFWRRLHVMVIGGGQHAASTDTRGIQWEMGLPKVATHPLGHGVGRSGLELSYYNPGSDNPTVDSYYLTLLLDYGPLGLLLFLALFGVVIWFGFRAYNRARTPEMKLLAPLTVALINFIIIKSVASTEINFATVFIMTGCIFGLIYHQRADNPPEPAMAVVPDTKLVGRGWSGAPAGA